MLTLVSSHSDYLNSGNWGHTSLEELVCGMLMLIWTQHYQRKVWWGVTSRYSETTGGLNVDTGLNAELNRGSWQNTSQKELVCETLMLVWTWLAAQLYEATGVQVLLLMWMQAECEHLARSLYRVDNRVTHIVDLQAWLEQTAKSYRGQQNGHSCACSFFSLSLSLCDMCIYMHFLCCDYAKTFIFGLFQCS